MNNTKYDNYDYLPIVSPNNGNISDGSWRSTDDDIEASGDETLHQNTTQQMGSKWDSDMFHVNPDQISNVSKGFDINDFTPHHLFITAKWFILPLFAFFVVLTVLISILCLSGIMNLWESFIPLLSINIIGCLFGMMFVYKFASINDCADFMNLQNLWYAKEEIQLHDIRAKVSKEAKAVHFTVHKLKKISKDVAQQYHHYDKLREELKGITHDNQDIYDMLDHLNTVCSDLHRLIQRNERAHLLSIYYGLLTRNQNYELTQNEYQRLLGNLNQKTKKKIEDNGGFHGMDTNGDGKVDVGEFQKLLDKILGFEDDKETQVLSTLQQLDYTGIGQINTQIGESKGKKNKKRKGSKGFAGFDGYQVTTIQ